MNRTFWTSVCVLTASLTMMLTSSDPLTTFSGVIGLLLLSLSAYQGETWRGGWADWCAVAVGLVGVLTPVVQIALEGQFALSPLLVANLGMALACAGFLLIELRGALTGGARADAGKLNITTSS